MLHCCSMRVKVIAGRQTIIIATLLLAISLCHAINYLYLYQKALTHDTTPTQTYTQECKRTLPVYPAATPASRSTLTCHNGTSSLSFSVHLTTTPPRTTLKRLSTTLQRLYQFPSPSLNRSSSSLSVQHQRKKRTTESRESRAHARILFSHRFGPCIF